MNTESNAATISCPECKRHISMEDVNVSKDIALCRSCNQTYSFSELLEEDATPIDASRPPKGLWFRERGDGFELGSSTRSAAAFFLIPFMCLWSGLSLGGIYGTQITSGKFNLGQSLFGLPFLFGTIILGSITLMCVFGKTVVSVRRNEGKVFVGVGPIGFNRRFKWNDIHKIFEDWSANRRNGKQLRVIVLEGTAKSVRFGSNIKDERRKFMFQTLKALHRRRTF